MRGLPLLLAAGCGRIGFTNTELSPSDAVADGASEVQPLQQGCDVTHPGALLCEGFEAPDVEWEYEVLESGSAVRSEDRGAHGAASLKVKINTIDKFKAARWGKSDVLPSLVSEGLHLREYLFMPSTTVIDDQLSIMVTGNKVDPFPAAYVLLRPGRLHLVVEAVDASTPFEFPRDRWVCVELHLQIGDASTGSISVDVDGSTIVSRTSVGTRVEGGYTSVDVGIHYATPMQLESTMFVDEVVADRAPIGCD